MPRPVLIHYRIFRNAGSSVDHALRTSFGPRWTTFEGEHVTDAMSTDGLRTFLAQSPTITAVSSRSARPPLPWPGCRPIVLIRHPIDRMRSIYDFVAADRTQPTSEIARARGFCGYVEWVLDGGPGGLAIGNYQTIHLSAATFRNGSVVDAPPTVDDLTEACEHLLSWPAIGLVDRFELSLQLFQELYADEFPGWRARPVRLNARRRSSMSLADRLATIRAELGNSLADRLEEANALDLQLYGLAERHFISLCATYDLWPDRSTQPSAGSDEPAPAPTPAP